jgi:hypothetical protein
MKIQFKLLARLLFNFTDEWYEDFYEENTSEIERIIKRFYADIHNCKRGYPTKSVSYEPFTENSINRLFEKHKIDSVSSKINTPTLCLTHDVDYIYPTMIQNLKRFLGRFDFNFSTDRSAYLDSLEMFIDLDQKFGKPTLFIANSSVKIRGFKRILQLLIDPSYKSTDDEFQRLKNIIKKYNLDVGLHGSFYSLERNFFQEELKKLEKSIDSEVRLNRQHWLNLTSISDLKKMSQSGVEIDSSIGWNGTLGYRCGMARPYPIVLDDNKIIWEVPMLIMDGILFDVLKLNKKDALQKSIGILDKVFSISGTTTLNWHERTFAIDYGWGETYKAILEYAKSKGFIFSSLFEATKKYGQ